MQEETTTCAVMSSKTREPYQTASNPEQTFSYFPGAILFQTGTSASTEGRTQCCPDNFMPKKPNDYEFFDNTTNKLTGEFKSYADWPVKKCVDRHFKSKGDPTSFVTENIDYTREWHSSFEDKDDNQDLHRQSVKLHDSKMAYYNSDETHTRHRQYTVQAVKNHVRGFPEGPRVHDNEGEIRREPVVRRQRQEGGVAGAGPRPHGARRRPHGAGARRARTAARGQGRVARAAPAQQHGPRRDHPGRQRGVRDRAHRRGTMPKWANVQSMEEYFSVQATLRRYEWHLLASDKIWDISRAAMETLLILNMHLKRSAANTIRNVGLYHHLHNQSRMPPHLQGRLEAQDQRTLRAQKMPREWILAQLRFNLQNPYRGTMYDKASLT